MLDVVLAIVLLVLALAVLAYVGLVVLGAFRLPIGKWLADWRFRGYAQHARRADELLARGDEDAALVEIRRAFHLHAVGDAASASRIANHHTGLLSRILTLASDGAPGSVRLLALAKVDKLLNERAALQGRYITLRRNGVRSAAADVAEQLRRNGVELGRALDTLVDEIRSRRSPRARYH